MTVGRRINSATLIADVLHRLADGVDPDVITRAEAGSFTWTTRAAPA